jgi:hypothetical protein
MSFKKCPKCESEAFENFSDHSLCYACNYDTVNGYVFGKCHNAKDYRRMILKKEGLPLGVQAKKEVAQKIAAQYLYTRRDRDIASQAMELLSPIMQTVIFLKFWSGHETKDISELIYMPEWEVESNLLKAFAQVKDYCLNHADFSMNQLRKKIERDLTSQMPCRGMLTIFE